MTINENSNNERLIGVIEKLTRLIILLLFVIGLIILVNVFDFPKLPGKKNKTKLMTASELKPVTDDLWHAPELSSLDGHPDKELILYGRELIVNTSIYIGPMGKIQPSGNGMNCQNCHLNAGTKPYGNNYGSVASTYPKFRARSGTSENIFKRINDCFERSINGKTLDTTSKEMIAMSAYINWLGKDVPKGEKAKGSGLKKLEYLDRAANSENGKIVFEQKCASCHNMDGSGQMKEEKNGYIYPPLWGENSYNDAAGLSRVSNFAKYVKFNMPLGVDHKNPQLSDEDSWDVAAFVNSQPRPHKETPFDWPKIEKKPVDHPFGPYADNFSESQHKFGPFIPIEDFYKKKAKNNNTTK